MVTRVMVKFVGVSEPKYNVRHTQCVVGGVIIEDRRENTKNNFWNHSNKDLFLELVNNEALFQVIKDTDGLVKIRLFDIQAGSFDRTEYELTNCEGHDEVIHVESDPDSIPCVKIVSFIYERQEHQLVYLKKIKRR